MPTDDSELSNDSDLVSNPWPRPGFVAIPATAQAQGDSVNDLSSENLSDSEAREAREHVQHLIDSWVGDAKTILKFVGPI
jgi:hypothetical protein